MSYGIKFRRTTEKTPLEVISKFENEHGIKFPHDYKIFIQEFAGSRLSGGYCYEVIGEGSKNYETIYAFLGFREVLDKDHNSIEYMMEAEGFPDKLIPVARGGSVDCACLDYRDGEPKISFWHFELEAPIVVASSFSDFLNMLKTEDELE